jgi:hypothetical protein
MRDASFKRGAVTDWREQMRWRGISARRAAFLVGIPRSTLARWRRQWNAEREIVRNLKIHPAKEALA